MESVTPVLVVDAIEPCLPFWESIGFAKTLEVPEGDVLGFVMLQNGPITVMVQTRASVAKDVPELAAETEHARTFLFVRVPDLAAVVAKLGAGEVVIEGRETFYGSTEAIVREPGGNLVTFAQFAETAED